MVLLKRRNFAVFFAASILICIPLAFYYQNANQFLTEIHVAHATGKQTLGQMSEVLFMLMIPIFLKRFGMKLTLLAEREWKRPRGFASDSPREDMTRGWKELDRSVAPVEAWVGGHHAAMKRLEHFCGKLLKNYEKDRNRPEAVGWTIRRVVGRRGHRDQCR